LYEAVIVTLVVKITGSVLSVKVAVVAYAGTVTLVGTEAANPLLLDRNTTAPPAGAGPLSVTVPIEEPPPVTLDGLSVSERSVGGRTASEADWVTPLFAAEIDTEIAVPTGAVVAVNVTLLAPAGTVTEDGTAATEESLDDKETTIPPLGAGPLTTTVPTEELPPVRLAGAIESDARVGGTTVRDAVSVVPLDVAVMVTEADAATGAVATVNVALVAPAGTVTAGGTLATEGSLLDKETTAPPLGAALLKLMMPVEEAPPVTVLGLTESKLSVEASTPSSAFSLTPL
jgi:hypothetical protein